MPIQAHGDGLELGMRRSAGAVTEDWRRLRSQIDRPQVDVKIFEIHAEVSAEKVFSARARDPSGTYSRSLSTQGPGGSRGAAWIVNVAQPDAAIGKTAGAIEHERANGDTDATAQCAIPIDIRRRIAGRIDIAGKRGDRVREAVGRRAPEMSAGEVSLKAIDERPLLPAVTDLGSGQPTIGVRYAESIGCKLRISAGES